MQNVSEKEALALMALPKICDDIGDWTPVRTQAGSVHLVAGVLRPDGVSARLQVDLDYRVGRKTGLRRFKLSLFHRQHYGLERVYQLDIVQSEIKLKDAHSCPHEHVGNVRIPGKAAWSRWEYDEVLTYFCERINLKFNDWPPHPESLQLKGEGE